MKKGRRAAVRAAVPEYGLWAWTRSRNSGSIFRRRTWMTCGTGWPGPRGRTSCPMSGGATASLDDVRELASYWRTGYDWRVHERQLNSFPQCTTEIDGQRVHFLHVRSGVPGALPLIMTHGWPGSVVEFMEIIGPLTDPGAHGGAPGDAFDLVVPSIPGFGFSGPTRSPGWNVSRVARAWAELMRRLGYERYGAQGGDWGSSISRELGVLVPEHVAGVHLNMLVTRVPPDAGDLTEVEQARAAAAERFRATGS